MGWFGKLALGSLGMIIGGPLGAIAGAAIGHHLIDKNAGIGDRAVPAGKLEQAQASYFVCVFSILGKMAKADGKVTRDEIAVVEEFISHMNMPPTQQAFAKEIFNQAKRSAYTIDDFAAQFYQMNRHRPAVLYSFLDVLFKLAAADGRLHQVEEDILERLKHIFHISDQQFNSVKAVYFNDVDKYYKKLHCTSESTNQEIRANYRKLIKDFHPDTIVSKGLPEEFLQFAKERFQEIQEAYEKIRNERNF
ncbi:MAG: TerB family tellurite resistance protein [Deltaproteobacteria bacterium]|nr:TerB family tellurite resistance protein [Deltaproteobacteria bacterium]